MTDAQQPTDEQLCNLACALGLGSMTSPILRQLPHWRESMLNLHGLAQKAFLGDERAAAWLSQLRLAAGERATPQPALPAEAREGGEV